jgi:hypothetical protein
MNYFILILKYKYYYRSFLSSLKFLLFYVINIILTSYCILNYTLLFFILIIKNLQILFRIIFQHYAVYLITFLSFNINLNSKLIDLPFLSP